MAKRENNVLQNKAPPPSSLNKELLGVWNAWTRMGDREVVREAVVKGQHIEFAYTFLATRKDFDSERIKKWFINEVFLWILELLEKRQIFKASHILTNIILDPIEEFRKIFLETYNANLRDYLGDYLLKHEKLSEEEKQSCNLLKIINQKHELLLNFNKDCLKDLNIKCIEDKDFSWKCDIGTQLFFSSFDNQIRQFVTAECTWSFLLRNRNSDLLQLWIRLFFCKCSHDKPSFITPETWECLSSLFLNLPITEEMIDSMPNLKVEHEVQEIVYNELSQYGIFCKEEKSDLICVLKRMSYTETIERLYEILSGDHSSISLNDFYKLLLDYCVKENLYSILNWCDLDLISLVNVHDYNSKCLDLMKYLKCESTFEDFNVGTNILRIANFLSDDLVTYFERNPLVLLAVLLFFHHNINTLKDHTFTIKINDVVLTTEIIIKTFRSMPFLISLIRLKSQDDVSLYNLLNSHTSLNLEVFDFQSEHRELPNFNSNDLVQKHSYMKTIEYKFYLKQGRPSYASKVYLSNYNLELKLGTTRKILKLFINYLNDFELASCFITFLEMIGENSTNQRIYVKIAMVLQEVHSYESVESLLRESVRDPGKILEVLEDVLLRSCTLSQESLPCEVIDEVKKHEIAVKLAQLHHYNLPEVFLKYCAHMDLWLPFVVFIQTYHYPLTQVERLTQHFRNRVLAEHLYHGFSNEIQIDTQKELLMRDSRNFYLSRIGVRKSIDASSDSMYSSASSYGSTGSSSAGSDVLDDNLENESDMLHILIRCHNSVDPPKALLHTCNNYQWPIFAVLATSYEPDSIITHWLMWLTASCGIHKDISMFETIIVNANMVNDVLNQCVQMGYLRTLYDSFSIFLPENPLRIMIDFLNECANLNFDISVQTEKLDSYSKAIKKMKTVNPVDYELMYLFNKTWIESTSLNLVATMLHFNYPSRNDQFCCLTFLRDIKIDKYFTTSTNNLLKFLNVTNCLLQNECDINLDLSVIFNNEEADKEILSCVNKLLSLQCYSCALDIAKLQNIPTDFIVLKKWHNKFVNRISNNKFWEQCNTCLIVNEIDCNSALNFFEKCCEETNDRFEKYNILKIAHEWARRNKSKCLYDIEKRMWIVYFSLDIKCDSNFNSNQSEPVLYGEMKQILKTLESDTSQMKLTEAECIRLNDTVETLLRKNDFWQALRISKIFQHKNPDLDLIELCCNLAEGLIMPYQLNVEQRMLLIKNSNLRSVGTRRRRTLMSSKGFSSFSSASNSPISPGLTSASDQMEVPMFDTLMILETLQERAKNGAKIIGNLLMTYRIAANIEKSFQDIFKCTDSTAMLKGALNEDCCNKLEVVHDVICLFNWSKEKVADFLCEQLIEAIKMQIKLRSDSVMLWNLNLDTDFNVILQLLVENSSILGLKLYLHASSLHNHQDLSEEFPLTKISLIVELLIRSHDCFTADCNMEGISIVLRKCQSIISSLLAIKYWRLIVRLLTGVARYTEMNYVFHLLRENDQFEFLLCKGCRRDNALKVALLKYLKRYCPEDRELYRMVALHFTLFSEIAQLWEEEARSIIRNLIAISKLEMQNNELNIETEPFVLLTNTDGTKICINKAMINYTHAAEYHLQGEKLTKAMHAAKQAELLALQMSLLRGLPNNSTVTCILNLNQDQILSLICTSLSFAQTLILIDSISYKPDWSIVLLEQYIIRNRENYLEDFLASFPLTDPLLNDISKKFLGLSSISSQSVKNMKQIVSKSTSVYVKYKIASELGFVDLVEKLLDSNEIAYLKDTVWKKECDIENVNPNNVTSPKSNGEDTEDGEPLAKIAESKKTDFQKFMPTPDYSVVKDCPRRKALNYEGQRVSKDLFNADKEPKKNNSKSQRKERNLKRKLQQKIPTNKTKKVRLNPNQMKIKNRGTVLHVNKRGLQI
ncbi:hypothetical protein FQR65_LT05411 [Abscondita terminalis]|nr:hypothetical protein FQR65_LT05411 [Abscondita terminalis]